MPRALSIQSADFPELQRNAEAYIDKTRIIASILADTRCRHLFLSRPRRFGKTLLVSTLEALFQGHRHLFAGTWIDHEGHWDWAQDPYPVIRLDISLAEDLIPAGGTHDSAHAIAGLIQEQLALQYAKFSLPMVSLPHIGSQFADLIRSVRRTRQSKVVVLIDEYDTPITDILDHPESLEPVRRLMRAFYRTLKREWAHIELTFMTGITRVAIADLFSGANHFLDLSFAPGASTLLGYTQHELRHNADIQAAVAQGAYNLGCRPDDLMQALAQKYNGYLFATGGEPVCNPFALNRCLDDLQHPLWQGKWRLDRLPNYWAGSGTPHLLFHAWHQNLQADMGDPMQADIHEIEAADFNTDKPDLATSMYQSGYLTRRLSRDLDTGQEREVPALPNDEVEDTYLHAFQNWLANEQGRWRPTGPESVLIHQLRQAIETRTARDICHVVNALLRKLPSNLHFPRSAAGKKLSDYESYYHSHLHTMLGLAGLTVISEMDANGHRMDMGAVTEGHALVFELKLDGDAAQAARQALARLYASPWQDGTRTVTIFGLNFVSSSRLLEKCVKCCLGRFDPMNGRWQHEPVPGLLLDNLRGWPDEDLARFETRQAIDWDEVHRLGRP